MSAGRLIMDTYSDGVARIQCLGDEHLVVSKLEMEAILLYLPRFHEVEAKHLLSQLPKLVKFHEEQLNAKSPLLQSFGWENDSNQDDLSSFEDNCTTVSSVCSEGYCENALMRAKLRRQVRELKKQNAILQSHLNEAIRSSLSLPPTRPGSADGSTSNRSSPVKSASFRSNRHSNGRPLSASSSTPSISKQLQQKLELAEAKEAELQEEITSTKSEIAAARSKISEMESRVEELEAQLVTAEQELVELQGLYDAQVIARKEETEKAREACQEKDKKIMELQAEHLKKEELLLATYRETQRKMVAAFEDKERSMVTDFQAQEAELKLSIQTLHQEMEKIVEEFMEEKAQLEATIIDKEKENEDLNTEIEEQNEYEDWLKAEIWRMKQHAIQTLKEEQRSVRQALARTLEEMRGVLEETASKYDSIVRTLVHNRDALQEKFEVEVRERRRMNEEIHTLKGRIRVFCRVRPQVEAGRPAVHFPSENSVLMNSDKEFSFDKVFGPHSTQDEVFHEVEPLVDSVMDGFNACIFAYGQTGTGKTYTMAGTEAQPGVNPKAVKRVFSVIGERNSMYTYKIKLSMVEIYNEKVRDLLSDGATKGGGDNLELRMRQNQRGGTALGVEVEGLTSVEVLSPLDVDKVVNQGTSNRSVASTLMNTESSRSHLLLFLDVEGTHKTSFERIHGRLCLADLAGSERLSRSGASGDRMLEAQHINKSLSALGDVVNALQSKAKHVPFRNSKLTFLLQDMLNGGGKALMVLQVSPDLSDASETLCSLNFAARVSQVTLGSVKRSVESGELIRLQRQNEQLSARESALNELVQELKAKLSSKVSQEEEKDAQVRALLSRIRALEERETSELSETGSELTSASTATFDPDYSVDESDLVPVPVQAAPKLSPSSLRQLQTSYTDIRPLPGSSLQASLTGPVASKTPSDKSRSSATSSGQRIIAKSTSSRLSASSSSSSTVQRRIETMKARLAANEPTPPPVRSSLHSSLQSGLQRSANTSSGKSPALQSTKSKSIPSSSSSARRPQTKQEGRHSLPTSSSASSQSSTTVTRTKRRSVIDATTAASSARKVNIPARSPPLGQSSLRASLARNTTTTAKSA